MTTITSTGGGAGGYRDAGSLAMEALEAVLVELLQQVLRVLLLRQAMEVMMEAAEDQYRWRWRCWWCRSRWSILCMLQDLMVVTEVLV